MSKAKFNLNLTNFLPPNAHSLSCFGQGRPDANGDGDGDGIELRAPRRYAGLWLAFCVLSSLDRNGGE